MKTTIALLACLLPLAPSARAADAPAAKDAAPAPVDVITPLDVRDPSALVMGTGGQPINLSIIAATRAPETSAPQATAAKTDVDKTGVQRNKRSVALPIAEDQLLGVKPGDRVDLLGVFDTVSPSGAKETFSATVLQNIRVLGVTTTKNLRGKGVLTLEVNPVEAQYAFLALRLSDLGVAVRAPDDVEIHPMEMAAFRRLFR